MADLFADARVLVAESAGGQAEDWDVAGELPGQVLAEMGKGGLLAAQIPAEYGGLGATSVENGEFTAFVGSLCSSLRSVMTSNGMAAWAVERLADAEQRRRLLPLLARGTRAAVAFSEPAAGSDLSAISSELRIDGDYATVHGEKKWVTAAAYADLFLIVVRQEDAGALVAVPADADGLTVDRVPHPLGCRAAGHANLRLDGVRVPASAVLGGGGQPLPLLLTTALAAGRMSVAWGCVGILRACLSAVTHHAATRTQFGVPIFEHQLVARHVADTYVSEQTATRACEHASRLWDDRSPDAVVAAVLAKHVSAVEAAKSASTAVQVLASAGAQDGHVVARAYRDTKLMEIIEGSNEMCQLLLAQHAMRYAR
ncbi:acyl-CoA dehydrogenase family protein [Streptomyces olivaceoviridis]|uniref:acyl-CoA dehydrogenase family protein n=1 Tax=Streptomyces olivaceoviridis TaxID=1921 RepID=UPI0037024416